MLAAELVDPLRKHLEWVHQQHERDLADGYGEVWLPGALDRKYPEGPREWGWQWVFPSEKLAVDPRGGKVRRHHIDPSTLQRAVLEAGAPIVGFNAGWNGGVCGRRSWSCLTRPERAGVAAAGLRHSRGPGACLSAPIATPDF